MSANLQPLQPQERRDDGRKLRESAEGVLLLALLHSLTGFSAALRRYLKLTIKCEHCGK